MPFFANLAQPGRLDYPLFGVSLQRNASPGSLSLGEAAAQLKDNRLISCM